MTDNPTGEFEKIYNEISTKSDFHERFLSEEMYSIEFWHGWLFYLKGLENRPVVVPKMVKMTRCQACHKYYFCPQCGSDLASHWVHCPGCGSPLDWTAIND